MRNRVLSAIAFLLLCGLCFNVYAWRMTWGAAVAPALPAASAAPGSAGTAPLAEAGQQGGPADMKAANRAASAILRERMRRDRPTDFGILQKVKESEVVVVRGVYDHVETVLDAVRVPHVTIDPQDLDRADLNAGQLLLINCPGQISSRAVTKVRRFVEAGGFLFTTDWSLLNVLEKAFPGEVAYNQRPTRDDVVEVRVLKQDHTFLQHVQSTSETPKWWLESSSYPIRVVDRRNVEVLMDSAEMQRKYGQAPIAITFPYGDGRVLHIVSHYYLQRTDTRTAYEREGGGKFAESLKMAAPASAAADLSRTSAGAVKDAYAAQQMSANIIVAKQKQNVELQKVYAWRASRAVTLRSAPSTSSGRVAEVKEGGLLKVIEVRGLWTRVRTYSGEMGWLQSDAVARR